MRPAAWIITGLILVFSAQPAGADLEPFVPTSDEIAGWTTYQWPQDEDDLFWLIDGAGMVYVHHGFQEAVFQKYYNAQLIELHLEIYDQGTSANAENTYHDPSLEFGWEIPRDDFGVEGRVDTMALGSYKAEFWRDRYFVRSSILKRSASELLSLLAFCQLVDQKLASRPAIDGLPANGELLGWNRYLAASDSLALFSLLQAEAPLFWDGGCQAAIFQDYFGGRFILLRLELFDVSDAGSAQSLYHHPQLESGLELVRDDFGQEGRLDTTSSWTHVAMFWRDRYLARLEVQEKSDAALADLLAFSWLVDQKILSTGWPESDSESPPGTAHWPSAHAFPNPFNDEVCIRYCIPEDPSGASEYDLSIYNVKGQKVKELINQIASSPGIYEVRWDGKDDGQRPVASGVYFCSLNHSRSSRAITLILCR